ncbi:hypothetical protein RhiirA1_477385 [Rhizophagus irregularis]|uniref:Uncharacterized protein n=1 Tax=Rhizophagus irregularis TaxID=588596 RepID=A0A2N0QTK3_9GLOM|nr:hypothetical protein RhiirA1_477385 [Rhizophagus irregularis]
MSNTGDFVGTLEEDFLKFISVEGESFLSYTTFQLGQFVENGFLKTLFDKNPQQPIDKAQLLVDMFGESANLNNFAQQAAVTNIQHFTFSLIFFIALYASSRSWDYFAIRAYTRFGDMGDSESECPSADDEFGSTFLSIPKTTPKPVTGQKLRTRLWNLGKKKVGGCQTNNTNQTLEFRLLDETTNQTLEFRLLNENYEPDFGIM